MITRTLTRLVVLLSLCFFSFEALSGYRTYLDPRSMAMAGSGVASATKFNASFHNPALIAFNRGDKPDKIYLSASQGLREIHTNDLERKLFNFQESGLSDDFIEAVGEGGTDAEILANALPYQAALRDMNLVSYRKDEYSAFSLLADTRPITVNFYVRTDYREMTVIRNRDEDLLAGIIERAEEERGASNSTISQDVESSVDDTTFELTEFGATVATTNVIDYNIPISWGFTPKLIQMNGSHRSTKVNGYDLGNRATPRVSENLLEWNLDIGFAALLTDDYLSSVLGLDGWWLEGEWIVGLVGMNMFPTDFTPFFPPRDRGRFPGNKRAINTLYQFGLAHYREDYMITMDIDLNESEVFDFEGMTRFLSFAGEYYWRDDFHLRAGVRFNTAQSTGGRKDKALLTGGFLYQPHGFSIEASAVINEVERGGTIGFGLAF